MRGGSTITVIPGGGLCNRMAVVDSALALGRRLGRPVRLVWLLRAELNCRFQDLFEPLAGLSRVVTRRAFGGWGHLRMRTATWAARCTGATAWRRRRVEALRTDPAALLEAARRAPRLRIRADQRFFGDDPPCADFRLVPSLAAQVARQADRLRDAVGVHVRRTDNAAATRRSPLAGFLAALHAERERRPQTRFFLSTDDVTVRAAFAEALGEAVFWNTPANFDRRAPEAIRAALVDLYCLASCRALVGSYGSTFSDMAALLRGIPRQTVDVGP